MTLRAILLPRPIPPEERAALRAEIARIAAEVRLGHDASASIAALNARSGRSYRPKDFANFEKVISLDEFVNEAGQRKPTAVPDITRDELVEIVSRAKEGHPRYDAENEGWWMELFEANVPMPEAANLLFLPPGQTDMKELADWDPTPEQVVDLALRYVPEA